MERYKPQNAKSVSRPKKGFVYTSTEDTRRRRLVRDLLAEVEEREWRSRPALKLYGEWLLRDLFKYDRDLWEEWKFRAKRLGITVKAFVDKV